MRHIPREDFPRIAQEAHMRIAQHTPVDLATAPYAALLLRLTLGVVFVAHALFKMHVLGMPASAAFFADHGFPGWTAYPVTLAELFGGIALTAGIYPRLTALALIPVMLGAFTVHWPNGWYFGAPHGGWEYIAVLIAALLTQAGLGGGRFALSSFSREQDVGSRDLQARRPAA
jgi:putative oxidoreductase